jgi:AcrR family transcriptional regulator
VTGSRERIARAARELVDLHGLERCTMRAIGQRVGVSAAAIYRHFPHREALLAEVLRGADELFVSYLARGLRGRTPLERLARTGDGYLAFALDHPHLYEALFVRRDPPTLPRFEDVAGGRGPGFQLLVDRVRDCMAGGALPRADPAEVALALWALVHGLATLCLSGRFGEDRAAVERLFRRMGRRAVGLLGGAETSRRRGRS